MSLQLQPAAAVQLTLLRYTVSHEQGFVRSGPVAIGEHQTFTFKVDALPPAFGYVVTAYAEGTITKTNTKTVCTGQARFEIRTAQSTAVWMRLQCDGGAPRTRSGTAQSMNICPTVGVISAAPAQVPVGQELQLAAEVQPDLDGPSPVAYRWSAETGLLSSPRAAQTKFLCNRAGVIAVRLEVSDGDPTCAEPPASVYVTCTAGTTSSAHTLPTQPAAAGSSATKLDKDAGNPAAIDAATGPIAWDAGVASGDPWPKPEDMPGREPRRRRERPAAGSGGHDHAWGGAGATAPEPRAGSAGSEPDPDEGESDEDWDEADAGPV